MFGCASEGAPKHGLFQSRPGDARLLPLSRARCEAGGRGHIKQLKPLGGKEKGHFFARIPMRAKK
jgi:hypothetical protein